MPAAIELCAMERDAVRERFEKLLATHGAAIGRVARVYARAPDEAADLAQEIAVAVWRALPNFRGECSERTFVFRVAHNRGISHRNAERTREERTPLIDPPAVPDHTLGADLALDAARQRAALWKAIEALPVGARAVLTLALEGMSHEEIAEVLGSTANSVAVRLSRARADLRARMESGS